MTLRALRVSRVSGHHREGVKDVPFLAVVLHLVTQDHNKLPVLAREVLICCVG